MSRKPKGLVGGGKRGGKKSSQLTWLGGAALLVGIVYVGSIFYAKSQGPTPAGRPTRENTARHPKPPKSAASREERRGRKASAAPEAEGTAKHANLEWTSLPRNMDECLASQDELMSLSVPWPGFHALCIAAVEERPGSPGVASVTVSLHHRSGAPGQPGGTRNLHAVGDGQEALDKLIAALQDELLEYEFQQVDPMVSTSAYDHVPNPWHLFTQRARLAARLSPVAHMRSSPRRPHRAHASRRATRATVMRRTATYAHARVSPTAGWHARTADCTARRWARDQRRRPAGSGSRWRSLALHGRRLHLAGGAHRAQDPRAHPGD